MLFRKPSIIGPSRTVRISLGAPPIHMRGHGTVYSISELPQRIGIESIKCPAARSMAQHLDAENVLKKVCVKFYLLPDFVF
jgi:hypothetical protein